MKGQWQNGGSKGKIKQKISICFINIYNCRQQKYFTIYRCWGFSLDETKTRPDAILKNESQVPHILIVTKFLKLVTLYFSRSSFLLQVLFDCCIRNRQFIKIPSSSHIALIISFKNHPKKNYTICAFYTDWF
jgi:hypothetical protein